MLYTALLVSDMTHFCIKLWIFPILNLTDCLKILV